MKLSLVTSLSIYFFAIHLIFDTYGLGLKPQSSVKRFRRLKSPQPRFPFLLPPIRGQESGDVDKTPNFGGGGGNNGGGNGGGRTRKRGRTISPRKFQRTRQNLKKPSGANENRLPYEHILRARYQDYEERERRQERNQKLRLLAQENQKQKQAKQESASHNDHYHGNYQNPRKQTYQETSIPKLTQDDDNLSFEEFDPYAVPLPPKGKYMVPISKGMNQHHPQPVLPEPMPFTDSSHDDNYPMVSENDNYPEHPSPSKGFNPPRGFQAEAFNPGYKPSGFKEKAPGYYPSDSQTNAKRKHFNIRHNHNHKPEQDSYDNFGVSGYEESSPLPAVPSSLIGHRPDMNKQALVTEAPESALRWVDSKFIHNQHGTFTNQVLTEFVNTLNEVQEKARSLGDISRAEVYSNPNGRNNFSPLNDWSNYHKQFTFLVNDNVDAELPIDHEDVSQLNRRSDSPNGSENRHDTPQQRSIGINQPPEYRKHTPEEYDEPDYSAALPPPGNPVQDGFNKIDQLYRSNYWD